MTDLELISRYNALVEHDHTPAIERLDGDTWSIWDDQVGDENTLLLRRTT